MALGGKLDGVNLVELREVPKKYPYGAGLYFVVQASGSAAWAYRYTLGGVAREMGLGPYPAISLKKARVRAQAAAELKADGIDPLEHGRRLKAADVLQAAEIIALAPLGLRPRSPRRPPPQPGFSTTT